MKRAAAIGTLIAVGVLIIHATPSARGEVQGEDPALELVAKYRKAFPDPLHTLVHSFSLVSYDREGEEISAWEGRLVADFDNRRAVIDSFEKGELAERVVLLEKKAYRIDFERGETEKLSRSQHARYDLLFEQAARGFVPLDYSRLTYEREVRYGKLASGQQVTAAPALVASEPLISLRMVFSDDGKLIATAREVLGEGRPQIQLTVLDRPAGPADLIELTSGTIYRFDPGTGRSVRIADRKTGKLVFNEPVDDSLFHVGESAH